MINPDILEKNFQTAYNNLANLAEDWSHKRDPRKFLPIVYAYSTLCDAYSAILEPKDWMISMREKAKQYRHIIDEEPVEDEMSEEEPSYSEEDAVEDKAEADLPAFAILEDSVVIAGMSQLVMWKESIEKELASADTQLESAEKDLRQAEQDYIRCVKRVEKFQYFDTNATFEKLVEELRMANNAREIAKKNYNRLSYKFNVPRRDLNRIEGILTTFHHMGQS